MNVRKTTKIITDILMFLDFLFLMCHEVIRDLSLHGIFGMALFALFIFHHILNGGFYKSTFRGKYNATRILFSATTWILFLLMLLMAFSSVMVSSAVFTFSTVRMTFWARPLHTFSCCWGFLIMGFHLGLHLHSKLQKLRKIYRNNVIYFVEFLVFALGIFSIVHSQIYVYLFGFNAWKLSATNIFVCLAEYLCMTGAMIVLADFMMKICKKRFPGQDEGMTVETRQENNSSARLGE